MNGILDYAFDHLRVESESRDRIDHHVADRIASVNA